MLVHFHKFSHNDGRVHFHNFSHNDGRTPMQKKRKMRMRRKNGQAKTVQKTVVN